MVKLLQEAGKFIQANWIPITAGITGVVAGYMGKKYQSPIVRTTKKTTSTLATPFTWSYKKVKGIFSKKTVVEPA